MRPARARKARARAKAGEPADAPPPPPACPPAAAGRARRRRAAPASRPPAAAGEQHGVRAIAGEVLADRELEPGERAEREPGGEQHRALRSPDEEPDDEHHQGDEDDQLDQRERAPGRRRALLLDRLARLGRAAWRRSAPAALGAARPRAGADGGAGPRLAPLLRHQLSRWPRRAGGRSPVANGQPEESRIRHQLKSIPRIPQRGRECQWRQPGSPMSSFETITQRCSLGRGDHRLEQRPVGLLDVGPPAELGARVAQAAPRARREPARAPRSRAPVARRRRRCPTRGRGAGRPRRRSRRGRVRAARSGVAGPRGPGARRSRPPGTRGVPGGGRRCDRLAVFEHFGHCTLLEPVADVGILPVEDAAGQP